MKRKSAPRAEDVIDLVKGLVEDNEQRDRMYDRMDRLYDQTTTTSKQYSQDESVKRMTMPYATNAVDLVADLASQAEMSLTVPAIRETMDAKKDADEIEQWLLAVRKGNERRSDETFNADLAWITAQRGFCCVRTLFTDALVEKTSEGYNVNTVPVIMQVKDPRIIYPQWTATGIDFVAEVWDRRVGDIRRLYPDVLTDKSYENATKVEWVEYWDDTYRMYFADGYPVLTKGRHAIPHGYGVVPYAFGRARGTPRNEPEERYRPLLRGVEHTISNLDVWFSILATAGWSAVSNAWAVFSETVKDLDLTPGAINYLSPEDKIQGLQRDALPSDFFQLGTMLIQALQQGTFPFALYGESPGDLAGYAINLLNQAGRRPLAPIWSAIQSCYERAFYNVVHIAKNKVAPLVGNKVPLSVVVESGKADMASKLIKRKLTLDTSKVDKSFECTVKLTDPLPADKAGNLRMAVEAVTARLLSKETALQKFEIVTDAMAEMERISAEDVFARLAPYEGLRLAIERGYVADNPELPPGWILDEQGQPMPAALMQPPEQANPTAMNALSGQPEMAMLNQLAAGMPTQEIPQPMMPEEEIPPIMAGGAL